MILNDICGGEAHPVYQDLAAKNLIRQYGFLLSIIEAAVQVGHVQVSHVIIQTLNGHAIACLNHPAGRYRTTPVTVGSFIPPPPNQVPGLMSSFVHAVNSLWGKVDPFWLAAFCLWKLNNIHPFVNGNGRTARALCYYVLCVHFGGPIGGSPILPDRIRHQRQQQDTLLGKADSDGNLVPLQEFIFRLLVDQISGNPVR